MARARRRAVYLSVGAPHLEFPGVVAALSARGVDAELVHIDLVDRLDLRNVHLVNVRMARGYQHRVDFVAEVERLHARLSQAYPRPIAMANPLRVVQAGADKGRYLRSLAADGIETVPTRWLRRGTRLVIAEAMEEARWSEVVLKPLVSSGSWRTIRVSRFGASSHRSHFALGADGGAHQRECDSLLATHDACLQLFMPQILEEGEVSFVFLGGTFSHAVRKTVGDDGGWWAHERLGGRNYPFVPSADDLAWAQSVHEALVARYGELCFDRIDGIRGPHGRFLLLECELAIPRLLLPEGNAFARYASSIVDYLNRAHAGDAPNALWSELGPARSFI